MKTKQSWSERIKKRNKLGFSLVELVVVIAIMAIMTAVLAPSLLSYTERSRAQKDTSAMSEVTNAIMLALADQNVYDEVLCYTATDNVSCYVDSLDTYDAGHASYTPTKKSGDTVLQYMFGDDARLEDENPYAPAGVMRGVTITFEPEQGTNKSCFVLYNGVINKFGGTDFIYGSMPETEVNDDDELLLGGMASFGAPNNHYLYNRVRSIVGDKIELTSQTYRNSEYTVFIRMGTTGGNQADKQDAVAVYGQWNGTNLSYGSTGAIIEAREPYSLYYGYPYEYSQFDENGNLVNAAYIFTESGCYYLFIDSQSQSGFFQSGYGILEDGTMINKDNLTEKWSLSEDGTVFNCSGTNLRVNLDVANRNVSTGAFYTMRVDDTEVTYMSLMFDKNGNATLYMDYVVVDDIPSGYICVDERGILTLEGEVAGIVLSGGNRILLANMVFVLESE